MRNAVVTAALQRTGRQDARYQAPSQRLALELIDDEFKRNDVEAYRNANVEGVAAIMAEITRLRAGRDEMNQTDEDAPETTGDG